ncbi:hypothetical protein [Pseudoroseicyclus tamaricis]|uniref:Uncharacterized protein n=1 Tax=Pseudoroseicyclus tamaricis TaxID=2705421 RepID=A0A6B2JQF5_9RHOB|nr:hypothetical protein [Pseudoroseicyclus tamaricis]NDV00917.1 hypothetical protein [Pseudoroseicyclus tamaricis]
MAILVWIGAAMAVIGLAGILYSLVRALGARRAKLDDEAMRARLQPLVPINIGAFLFSFLGLCLVVVGVVLA